MAQNSATVMVVGNVVKAERKSGSFTDREDATRQVSYDFIEARVVTPEFDTVDVRFPSDGGIAVPGRDELVLLRCEARPAGGNLKITVQSVEAAPQLVSAGK